MMFSIGETECKQRIERVRKVLDKRNLDALYLTSSTSIFYLTGYHFISTERPAALIVPVDGAITFLGPLLEEDNIPLKTRLIEDIKTYVDYPGIRHPIEHFADFLKEMGLAKKRLGIDDKSGAAGMWGYEGPPITRKFEAKFVDMRHLIPSMRLIKSENEIVLMQESSKWANLACSLLQEYACEGMWDVAVGYEASKDTAKIMKKTLGSEYQPLRNVFPVTAYFRGQVGLISAIPHSVATKHMIKKGNVLIGEVSVDVGGYSCELERTMIVGKPSAKQRRYFEVMTRAQKAAVETIREGIKCSEVDKTTFNVFKEAGLAHLVKHHTGHGLGLEGHEKPWLDSGNLEPLKAGMIVSCEPGIYEKSFAGFRHSDTVLVTKEGSETLTYYPTNIDALIVG
jgi:Xaa-Pro dipeptidase